MGTEISGSTGINKIQNNAVDIADLSATGTPGTNFLRGDNTWAEALPTQSGNAGKFLTTDASTASWATVDALPTQSGNAGKFLTTDASTASWATVDIDNLPAFYAYKEGAISLADGVTTTLLLDESYDPNSAYDATTGKFIPQTAGKYLVQASTSFHISSVGHLVVAGDLSIRKNGSAIVPSTLSIEGTGMMNWVPMCNFGIVAMNGSSDYLTATMRCVNYTNNDATNARQSGFSAFLIKAD